MLIRDQAPRLRERIARTFVDEAVAVRRGGGTSDAEGNATGIPPVVATVDGRWGSPSARELEVAAQLGQELDSMFTAAPDEDLRTADLLDIPGRGRWRIVTVTVGRVVTRCGLTAVAA